MTFRLWCGGLSCILVSLTFACDPFPDPITGFYVNAISAVDGDGSDCSPFQSLTYALEVAASFSMAKIMVLQGKELPQTVENAGIHTDITVEGQPTEILIRGTLRISSDGYLTLLRIILKLEFGTVETFMTIFGGVVTIDQIEMSEGSYTAVESFGGRISINNSTFRDLPMPVLILYNKNSTVAIRHTTFTAIADLIEVDSKMGEGEDIIEIFDISVSQNAKIVNFVGSVSGKTRLSFDRCIFKETLQPIIYGNIANVIVEMNNSIFISTQQVVSGSLVNSAFLINNATFIGTKSSLFDLSVLKGNIALSYFTVSDAHMGPLVLLPANVYPPYAAQILISNCMLSNITNMSSRSVSLIFSGFSASVTMQFVEIRHCSVFEAGIFTITRGFMQLSDIYYHDSFGAQFALYESAMSVVTLANVSLVRISNDFSIFTSCILGTQCVWTNVSIVDSIDVTPIPDKICILLWAGFGSVATVRHSYYRNSGRGEPYMGASQSSNMTIADTTFENLLGSNVFSTMIDGFLTVLNVTLIRLKVGNLFSSVFAENCFNITNVKIVGNYEMSTFLKSNEGRSSVTDVEIGGKVDSMIAVVNSDLTLNNVNINNMEGWVCRVCISSRITLHSLKIANMHEPMIFQLAYSNIGFSELSLQSIVCMQFIYLESSEMQIRGMKIENVTVDSFGGLMSATQSSINIDSAVIKDLTSTLSIRIGLISIESSELTITNSKFSNFNSTLIYSVQSSVFISDSYFSDGGLIGPNIVKAVQSYGSVLWSDSSSSIEINRCTFKNLSADDGGVFHFSGLGTEIAQIENCTAISNWASNRGGFIYSKNVNVTIVNSNIYNNSAIHGGALYINGNNEDILASVDNTRFYNNSAIENGGAVANQNSKSLFRSCAYANNTAEYGPNISSEIKFLSVLNKTILQPVDFPVIEAVSGQMYTEHVVIGCLDDIQQIVATDNLSKLSLFTSDANSSIFGTTLFASKKGLFSIPKITLIGNPGSNVTIYGSLSSNLTQSLFTVHLRKCIPGEFFTENQCKLCTHNTYSFDPSQPCTLCSEYADCPEGWRMNLHVGYWRPSNMSDDIHTCLVSELCLGGLNCECAEGHIGVMCSQCKADYFKINQLQCLSCTYRGVIVMKGLLSTLIAVASAIFVWPLDVGHSMIHLVVFDYLESMRIIVNYNIYWPESLGYLYSVLGDIGSIGLTAFSDLCFWDNLTVERIYFQLIMSVTYIAALNISIFAISLLIKFLIQQEHNSRIPYYICYFVYLSLPALFTRALQMISCYKIGESYYLIYDPNVNCWSTSHVAYTLGLAVPILIVAFSVPAVLLIGSVTSHYEVLRVMPPWKYYCLAVFLIRKYSLIAVLLFSNAMLLCTQVSLVIAINIIAEISMYRRRDCQGRFFFSLYQSTLISSTLQSFFCVFYSASSSQDASKLPLFIIGNYTYIFLPLLYSLIHFSCRCNIHRRQRIVPTSNISSEGQFHSVLTVDPRTIVLENHTLGDSKTNLRAQDSSGSILELIHSQAVRVNSRILFDELGVRPAEA